MTLVLLLNIFWQISVLALVTIGLAIVFGQLGIMNMAHGEFVMIGAYAPVITAQWGLDWWWQLPVCLLSTAIIALIIERTIVRHLYGRLFDSLLATWGISLLLRELVEIIFGRGYQFVATPVAGATLVMGNEYPTYRLLVIVFTLISFTGLFVWYRRSRLGTRIRAMVENPVLARSAGINTGRLSATSFVFGCMTAGLAGMLVAPTIRVEPMMGVDFLIKSFFALVVGGLGTLQGLVTGSTIIAGSQSIVSSVLDQTYGYIFVLVLSILFLWIRPNGVYRSN
ncbi:MAG: branched-chain amino acid ABC transporter permease [Cohaesibacteraceae bacterium]|nr:branched-chain amino acid ABC transporter permease [Cohaesibacteraceae bacterium]